MSSADSNIVYGIFAHEVGHLIRGDAWIGKEKRHQAELNADKFAGHIMGLMNLPQEIAIASLNDVDVNITKTHPAKIKREAIIVKGWLEGQANRKKINSASVAYLMECKSDDDSPFRIYYLMQGKSEQKTGFYNIACQIVGTPEKLRTIKKVTYYLHPSSFEKNSVKYKGNQVLSLEIWGSFELRASVVCEEDGIVNEYQLQENLAITDGKGRSVDKGFVPDVYIDNIDFMDKKEAKISLVPLVKEVNFPSKLLRPSKRSRIKSKPEMSPNEENIFVDPTNTKPPKDL
ncbi:hypothetical protein CWM47_03070 [Spirosoma pollinicola]|uniref:Prokaryotic YEATS domain-containing protein n=2 Tax=Spirosoma pollinicola TaxID=2057025 RepID=A0A2K8YTC5_9BACT|nr:hypothetical protein CWM47_03070 [Spirosoma pollinicola]